MRHLMVALGIEVLKLRRTLALALTAAGPLLIALLQFAGGLQRAREGWMPETDVWTNLAQNTLLIWNLMMLPLFITLQTALLAGIEHSCKAWKRVFAAPLPRAGIYVAKQAVGLALIGLSMVVLAALIVLVGLALNVLEPSLGLTTGAIPWRTLLLATGRAYLASWLLVALHTWIATRWPSFGVATAVGILTMVSGILVLNDDRAVYYPWTMPWLASHGTFERGVELTSLLIGFLAAPLVALLACWDVTHRDALGAL